jgi:hypothetical protein
LNKNKIPTGKSKLRPVLVIAVVLVLAIFGCSTDSGAEPTPYDRDIFTPYPGPPQLPIIFNGKYTVDGEAGPADQTIYAEFVHGGSPSSTTVEGRYIQVILSPVSIDDLDSGVISFYLGTREGDHVRADETWTWNEVNQPTNQVLDLSFPRFPDS